MDGARAPGYATDDNRTMAPDRAALKRLIDGFLPSQAIHVAATLGIADLLADGPRASDQLAAAAGADPDALHRLLRALARVGVLDELPGRRFALTELGDGLRSDAPGSLQPWAAFVGRSYAWDTWSHLEHSVRTGETAFRSLHGRSVWEYRAEHPEESAIFDHAMTAVTRTLETTIVAAYDFGRFGHIVDVGGGRGAFLAALLQAHPSLTGTLFDQEHVAAGAAELLERAGVADRCRIVAGSFFDEVPTGGDAYVLKSIIHDWEDEQATAILRTCAAALAPDARVLVVEHDLADPSAAWIDLQMLVMVGGRERTEQEYTALFETAQLEFLGSTPVAGGFAVLEAGSAAA